MGSWGIVIWLIGLSVMTFFAVAWLLDISNRQRQLQERLDAPEADTEGVDYADAEYADPLRALTERLAGNEERTQQLHDELRGLTGNLPDSIQCVGLVRFQAFSDYGGDQSFALALANASGDGVVLSGIFAREGSRVIDGAAYDGEPVCYTVLFELPHEGDRIEIDLTISPQMLSEKDAQEGMAKTEELCMEYLDIKMACRGVTIDDRCSFPPVLETEPPVSLDDLVVCLEAKGRHFQCISDLSCEDFDLWAEKKGNLCDEEREEDDAACAGVVDPYYNQPMR